MDWLLGLMQNPALLFALGFVTKYFPGIRTLIANRAIPYVNVALAFLGALLTLLTGAVGDEIKPAVFASWYPEHTVVAASSLASVFGGLFGCIKSAIFNAGMAYLANKLLVNQIATRPGDSKQ